MQLTEHFSFDELTITGHSSLQESNRLSAQAFIKNLKNTAGTLEEIREILGEAMTITSGFRMPVLNKSVGGSTTSKHTLGLCADFKPSVMSVKDAFKLITSNKDKTPSLRKAIIEGVRGNEWIHIQSKVLANEPTEYFATTDGKNYEKLT